MSRRGAAGDVNELELHAVGIGGEDGAVSPRVVVLAGRIQNTATARLELARAGVHLCAATRPEGDLAEADPILAEPIGGEAGIRLLDPEATGLAEPARAPFPLRETRVAELRHEPG